MVRLVPRLERPFPSKHFCGRSDSSSEASVALALLQASSDNLSDHVLLRGGPNEKAAWQLSSRRPDRLDACANEHRKGHDRDPETARTQQHFVGPGILKEESKSAATRHFFSQLGTQWIRHGLSG